MLNNEQLLNSRSGFCHPLHGIVSIGRVHQHHIPGSGGEHSPNIANAQINLDAQLGRIGAYGLCCGPLPLDCGDHRASADGLEAQQTATPEGIKDRHTGEVLTDHGEQRLPHPT